MKHIHFVCYNDVFNASDVLLVLERHSSMEISIYPAFSCLNNATC